MAADFPTVAWNEALEHDARQLIQLALEEDLGKNDASQADILRGDITSELIVDDQRQGRAAVVSRQPGIAAGLGVAELVIKESGADLTWKPSLKDGSALEPGTELGVLSGNARQLLTCERVILNLLGRLCGIATLTSHYVKAVKEIKAKLYDTRKTTPGWRLLEKYAVQCGGGQNHRTGLYDAILIKDNHLCLATEAGLSPADAVKMAHERFGSGSPERRVIEIEVDTLEQLGLVLPEQPDIVLLDNMSCEQLIEAVSMRDATSPSVTLEASGGVLLETIGPIAKTGVDRISVGALTHSAIGLDVGLDWLN